MPLKMSSLFDSTDIGRGFHHAEHAVVPIGVSTQGTDFGFAQGTALSAVADMFNSLVEGAGQAGGTFPIMLKQVEGHTLCRLWAYTRQAAKVFDQSIN